MVPRNDGVNLTRDEKIRIRRQWLITQGITVTVSTANRLNVQGMDDLIDVVSRNLRLG